MVCPIAHSLPLDVQSDVNLLYIYTDATGFLTPEAEEAAVAAEAYTTPSQSASATSTGFAQAKEPTGGTGHR